VIGPVMLKPESVLLVLFVYLIGVPICWKSKAQKGVTLSSSEAEYATISEDFFKIYYLLNDMEVKVEISITVRCENVGAIFMAEKSSSGVRSQHIDTRYCFVCEHIEDWFIEITFAKLDDNIADMFTKNVI
jgi:hypothetical protein